MLNELMEKVMAIMLTKLLNKNSISAFIVLLKVSCLKVLQFWGYRTRIVLLQILLASWKRKPKYGWGWGWNWLSPVGGRLFFGGWTEIVGFYVDILVSNFWLVRDGKFVLLGTCWLFPKPERLSKIEDQSQETDLVWELFSLGNTI